MKENIRILIHGGAGTIRITKNNKDFIENNLEVLKKIILKNYRSLIAGASALEVAQQAVIELENYEGFNAGRGAVLNSDGIAELDAALMDGRNLGVGSVAAVQRIKNPISGARALMEYSQHVMLAGPNADLFCENHNVEMASPDYFIIEPRIKQLEKTKKEGHVKDVDSLGTVGAVVRDSHANLAAATSTGGKTNKTPGRVGDSPIIGAGTWADNNSCAISATGNGEMFIRCAFAHSIADMITYNIATIEDAAKQMLEQIAALGGEGGCIGINKSGQTTMSFNTVGMYRAWVDDDGNAYSAI